MNLNLTLKEKLIVIPFVLAGIGALFYSTPVDLKLFFSETYKSVQKHFRGTPHITVELDGRRFSAHKSGFSDTENFTFINPPSDINVPLPPELIKEVYNGSYNTNYSLTRLWSYKNNNLGIKLESNDTTYSDPIFLSYQDTLEILINKYKEKSKLLEN